MLIPTFVFLTSCGEIGEGAGPEAQIQSLLSCDLDDEPGFDLIFEQDIESTWNCLDESMQVFIKYVETPYEGYLSLDLLNTYIDKEKPDMIDDKPTIEQFFKLATLLVGVPGFVLARWPGNNPENKKEWHKFISKENISKIISFLKTFNKNAVELKREFESETQTSYAIHMKLRRSVEVLSQEIALELKKVFSKQNHNDYELDLHEFIDTFLDEDNEKDLEMVKSFTFVKRIFLAGKKTVITNTELSHLVEHFSKYITIFYDFTRFQEIRFDGKYKKFQLYEDDLTQLESLFFWPQTSKTEMFNVDDILKAASHFKDNLGGLDLADHKEAVLNLMDVVFDVNYIDTTEDERIERQEELIQEQSIVSMSKFSKLMNHFHNVFKKGMVFYDIYEKYRDILSGPSRLSINFGDYKPELDYEIENLIQFREITHNYRFFQEDESPYYLKKYRRNADAFFQIGVFEYAFKHVFAFIENKYPCDKEKYEDHQCRDSKTNKRLVEDFKSTMTLRQVERLILEIKSLLVKLKIIIPKREASSANNATLMTDLFQFQSGSTGPSGSGRVEVHEASEFAVSVFSALDIGDVVLDKLRDACTGEWEYNPDEYPGCIIEKDDGTYSDENCEIKVQVACFRRNFLRVLFSDWNDENGKLRNFKTNFPLLHTYVYDELTPNQQIDFLIQTELFARTCYPMNTNPGKNEPRVHWWLEVEEGEPPMDLPEVPMGEGDMLSILGGLLNIESTLLRFDTDETKGPSGETRGNFNNRLDASEVDRAFEDVYKPAIEGLVRSSLDMGRNIGNLAAQYLSKTIFQYLIKKGSVPTMGELFKFLVFDKKKKAPATRHTIAIILKTISEKMGALCEPKDLSKEANDCTANDPTQLNPDKCPCTIKEKVEEIRLKHCYPDLFPPAGI